jgi:hypothetical protein
LIEATATTESIKSAIKAALFLLNEMSATVEGGGENRN